MKKRCLGCLTSILCLMLIINFTTVFAVDTNDEGLFNSDDSDKGEPSDWAISSIDSLKAIEIIEDSSIYPYQAPITREAFSELVFKAYQYKTKSQTQTVYANSFKDTNNIAILALKKMGIINGKTDNHFNPKDKITREEVAVVISNLLTKIQPGVQGYKNIVFSDCDNISSWAKDSVDLVTSLKIINGNSNNQFMSKEQLTYEQAMVIVNNIVELDTTTQLGNNENMLVPNESSKLGIKQLLESANSYKTFLSNYPNYNSIDYYCFGGGEADENSHDIASYNYYFGSVSFCNNIDSSHNYYLYDIWIEKEGFVNIGGYDIGDKLTSEDKLNLEKELSKTYGIDVSFVIDINDIISSINFSNHTKFLGNAG